MNCNLTRSALLGVLLLFGTSMANGQQVAKLGELLDKGGKRVEGAELKALLAGATTIGTTFGGQLDIELTWADDGKVNGRFWGGHPEMRPLINGTWKINDEGKNCIDLVPQANQIPPIKGCGYWYSLNNAYYVAASEDRGAPVRPRKIKR
jgi:hypothetical protein